jgi:hypothetical protein
MRAIAESVSSPRQILLRQDDKGPGYSLMVTEVG